MNFDQATLLWREIEVGLLKENWSKFFKGKILDLGCGEGEIAKKLFFNKGLSFVKIEWGLDNDELMVGKAKKSGVYSQVILGDARKMEIKTGSIDLVFSNSVLEHIKEVDQVLAEVGRILKPGGRLIATMPSDKLGEYLGLGKLYAKMFNKKYSHYNLENKEGWEKRLKRVGLRLVDSYYYLDRPTVREWHKLLWLNKLGIQVKNERMKLKRLKVGAGLAIMGVKI